MALERVVHHLGRVEELLAPVDDVPFAARPTSTISGTSVYRISETPPPNAVAERCRTRLPARPRHARGCHRRAGDRRCSRNRRGAYGRRRLAGAWVRSWRRKVSARRHDSGSRPTSPSDARFRRQPHGLAPRAAAVTARDRGHLELVSGAEQAVPIERRAPTVADDSARLEQAQPRRREVVRRVVEDLPAADALETPRACPEPRRQAASRPRRPRRAARSRSASSRTPAIRARTSRRPPTRRRSSRRAPRRSHVPGVPGTRSPRTSGRHRRGAQRTWRLVDTPAPRPRGTSRRS